MLQTRPEKRACTIAGFLVIHLLSLTYSNKCSVDILLSTVSANPWKSLAPLSEAIWLEKGPEDFFWEGGGGGLDNPLKLPKRPHLQFSFYVLRRTLLLPLALSSQPPPRCPPPPIHTHPVSLFCRSPLRIGSRLWRSFHLD